MSFLPIIVMNSILLVITVLLAVADKLLVSYGECKITVKKEGETKEFQVQGGQYLLGNLTENNFDISSSCGGKASCGYCKVNVLKGGGEILPTEELFMSREEKDAGTRLACQVKVKNDIEIFVPDFLDIVKDIVKNRTYNPSRRSTFNISNQIYPEFGGGKIRKKIKPKDKIKIDEIIRQHSAKRGALFYVLQAVNAEYSYFPENILWYISQQLEIPLSEIFRTGTFYNAFSLKPKGRNIIRVCLGTSCYVKGGSRILKAVKDKLGINIDETTKDLRYSLETVNCIGCCGQSPVISVNEEIYGYLKIEMIGNILNSFH